MLSVVDNQVVVQILQWSAVIILVVTVTQDRDVDLVGGIENPSSAGGIENPLNADSFVDNTKLDKQGQLGN